MRFEYGKDKLSRIRWFSFSHSEILEEKIVIRYSFATDPSLTRVDTCREQWRRGGKWQTVPHIAGGKQGGNCNSARHV